MKNQDPSCNVLNLLAFTAVRQMQNITGEQLEKREERRPTLSTQIKRHVGTTNKNNHGIRRNTQRPSSLEI
eukprot:scaffold3608_cov74-Skeletonema_menzelii.AAC.1